MTTIFSIWDNLILCKSPLFVPLTPNSTVSEVITPCFAFAFLPTILAAFSISCLAFLIFYGFVILSPRLAVTKLLMSKVGFAGAILLSCLIRVILIFFESNVAPETIVGSIATTVIAVSFRFFGFRIHDYFRWHPWFRTFDAGAAESRLRCGSI